LDFHSIDRCCTLPDGEASCVGLVRFSFGLRMSSIDEDVIVVIRDVLVLGIA